jgi:transcriptional regulator with XRE-family HTH domain
MWTSALYCPLMDDSSRQLQRGTHDQKVQLGREIKAARVRKGWDQIELAEALERSQEWVSRVERGALVLSVFEYARLAQILNIPPSVIESLADMQRVRPR